MHNIIFIIALGIVVALKTIMARTSTDKIDIQDAKSERLAISYTAFYAMATLACEHFFEEKMSAIRNFLETHEVMSFVFFVLLIVPFVLIFIAFMIDEDDTVEENWIHNYEYVVSRKKFYNRASLIICFLSIALFAILCLAC